MTVRENVLANEESSLMNVVRRAWPACNGDVRRAINGRDIRESDLSQMMSLIES